ncbi:hypothetical protein PoHVEF18_010267 [Penicillium ochrochloron]
MPSSALVEDLCRALARVTTPSELLLEVLQDEKKARTLYNMVQHRYKFLTTGRSDNDEDGEMTVFDKVLIDLWHQEHQLENIGLLEFFIEEFMMAKSVNTYPEKKALVFAQLHGQELIDAAFSNPEHLEFTLEEIETIVKEGDARQESALGKLIRVYQEAKADFYFSDADKSGISNKCNDKFNNVRFLRDTAENLLRHMKAQGHDSHPLMPEVEKMIAVSGRHAEHLSGGRKRVFELPEDADTRPVGSRWKYQRREHRNERFIDRYRPGRGSHGDRYEPEDRYDRRDRYDRDHRDDRHRDDDSDDRRHEHDDDRSDTSNKARAGRSRRH